MAVRLRRLIKHVMLYGELGCPEREYAEALVFEPGPQFLTR